MLKWTLLLTTVLYILPGMSAERLRSPLTAADACIDCANGRTGKTAMDALRHFSQEMEAATGGALVIEVISDKMGYADKCENFVGNGEVNKWGRALQTELGKPKYSTLIEEGPKDIELYCPNYQQMHVKDRKAVYILTLAAMAHYESSCIYTAKNHAATNGVAAGLLQLHKGKEGMYSSGCRKGDSADPERSLLCGLSMLNDQIVRRNERLFSSASYWEVLRPRGRSKKAKKIMTALTKIPACAVTRKATTRVAQQ